MRFEELGDIIREQGIDICPICGTPYSRYHRRQRTCGTEECKRLWKNKYLRERRERLIAEDKEAYNLAHAEAQRKSRHRKKAKERADRNYAKLQEHWERIAKFDDAVENHGIYYGKRQMEKTLALVPKIDVSGFAAVPPGENYNDHCKKGE